MKIIPPVGIDPGTHPHALRAKELELVGMHTYADRVARCADQKFPHRRCKLYRLCPTCSAEKRLKHERFVAQSVGLLRNHGFLTLSRPSRGLSGLKLREAVEGLNEAFTRLQGQKIWWEHFGAGVATLEPKLSQSEKRWSPHFHIIADLRVDPASVDLDSLNRAWRRCSNGWGKLEASPALGLSCHAPQSAAKYLCKGNDWFFEPGAYSPDYSKFLFHGMYRKSVVRSFAARKKAGNLVWVE